MKQDFQIYKDLRIPIGLNNSTSRNPGFTLYFMRYLLILVLSVSCFSQEKLFIPHYLEEGYSIECDGVKDATSALNAWGTNQTIKYRGKIVTGAEFSTIENCIMRISGKVTLNRTNGVLKNNIFIVDTTKKLIYNKKTKLIKNVIYVYHEPK